MSCFAFNSSSGPIFVAAEVSGPAGTVVLRLILDTGATTSIIKASALSSVGYDPAQSTRKTTLVTGASTQNVPLIVVTRLSALNQHRVGIPVLAHTVPPSSGADGLLGLDFLRGHVITIDFQAGQITVA